MRYKIREGIVMETICGTTLLIATLEAAGYCPYAVQLNEASAYIWAMLFQGKTVAQMTGSVADDFGIPEQEARDILERYLEELKEQNYLLTE